MNRVLILLIGAAIALIESPAPIPTDAQLPELPAAVCDTLTAERDKFGAIESQEQLTEILNRTAWVHRADGWGLSTKRGGHRCPSPGAATGTEIACDILSRKTGPDPLNDSLLWDVMADAGVGAPSRAQCGAALGPPPSDDRPWAPPSDPGGVTPPPPPPPPTCETCEADRSRLEQVNAQLLEDLEDSRRRLAEAEAEVDRERAARLVAEAAVAPLEEKVRQLEQRRCSFTWAKLRCELK